MVSQDHIIGSPTDFAAMDMDDEDEDEDEDEEEEEEQDSEDRINQQTQFNQIGKQVEADEEDEDEDVKTLQLLLQQSKGFYSTSNEGSGGLDDEEDDDFDQYEEDYKQEEGGDDDEEEEDEFDQFRFGPRGLEHVNPDTAADGENVTPTSHTVEEQKSPEKKSRRSLVVGHKKAVISGHAQQIPLAASREHQFYFDD